MLCQVCGHPVHFAGRCKVFVGKVEEVNLPIGVVAVSFDSHRCRCQEKAPLSPKQKLSLAKRRVATAYRKLREAELAKIRADRDLPAKSVRYRLELNWFSLAYQAVHGHLPPKE
jgi:hypothetical protein